MKFWEKPKNALIVSGIALVAIFIGLYFLREISKPDLSDCAQFGVTDRFQCYKTGVELIIAQRGINSALAEIKILQDKDVLNAPSDCHLLMHFVGYKAYEKYQEPKLVDQVFGNKMSLCYGGFRHGFLSMYFETRQQDTPIVELMKNSCGQYWDSKISFSGEDCFHGIGHALTFSQKNIVTPLIYCEKLLHEWQQSLCGHGVFMEYMYAYGHFLGHTADIFLMENMKDLCDVLDARWQAKCYSYIVPNNYQKKTKEYPHHGNLFAVTRADYAICEDAPNKELRSECYTGTGATLSLGAPERSLSKIQSRCQELVPNEFVAKCYIDSAYFHFNFQPYQPGVSEKATKKFCDSFKDMKEYAYCVVRFKNLQSWYSNLKKKAPDIAKPGED